MSKWVERRVDDVVVIDVTGSLTIGKHDLQELFQAILARGDKKILVNLGGVPYMDSTSVGDLIVGHLESAKHDAEFKLVGMQPRILELLTMHHLVQVFEHYEDESEAIASFAG